ncbi:hypothetical protein GCM10015535_66700 [Streptomyces gelaticus]|uniref:Uncharacterized protein n=1 Tax=Streptomyces gelaticus TaxID=285446 RepID=A0ABQ2W9G4_9ACTN|nr:hypothetical protein GCM10015535_66700 [Streptomyces gelaticus]
MPAAALTARAEYDTDWHVYIDAPQGPARLRFLAELLMAECDDRARRRRVRVVVRRTGLDFPGAPVDLGALVHSGG